MKTKELESLTTTDLARRLRHGELSPVEVTIAYLERIGDLDSRLGAYITLCAEHALDAARAAEQLKPEERLARPLHGVPFAVKDQFLTKGIVTTAGSEVMRGYVPTEDATVVARLREAGAILLGKLNMSQFAAGMDDRYPYAEPKNPWDLTRTPGNSSGGSAIAVAASLASFTLGEDTGGSVRGPASSCGITGLRPSWGLVSKHGMLPFCWSMDTAGPMGRTVEDLALILGRIAGHDEKDPLSSRRDVPAYAISSPDRVRLRAAVVDEWIDPANTDPDVIVAVRDAVRVLESVGLEVDTISWPRANDLGAVLSVISESDAAFMHRDRLRTAGNLYGNNIRRRLLAGALVPSQVLQKAVRLRAVFRAEWLALFSRYDVILSPTMARPAEKISYIDNGIRSLEEAERKFTKGRNQRHPAAIAGTPALSVPCGLSSSGLPIGLQVMANSFDEQTAFVVGHAYQAATKWHLLRPQIADVPSPVAT